MSLSAYSDFHAFVIRPESGKGVVTKADQKKLGSLFPASRKSFLVYHFNVRNREESLRRITAVRLSKPMLVTEVTDKQYGDSHKMPETIKGTGIAATKKQLAESFVIGRGVA